MRVVFVFFAACVACSNDTFSGDDAATDGDIPDAPIGEAAPPIEGGSADGMGGGDATFGDAGNLRFCLKHTGAVFCDDFDSNQLHPWSLWTTWTPNSATTSLLTFIASGSQGQGAQAKPVAATAFLTEAVSQSFSSISFDMMLPGGTILSSTYARVTSSNGSLKLGASSTNSQLSFTGSDGTAHTFSGDSAWHTFKIVFNAGVASLLEDATQVATAPFPQPSSINFDIGYVAGTAGGTVDMDNVLIE